LAGERERECDWLAGVSGALKNFYRVNNVLPDRIVVFRDGVGDGQLETVHEHEVKQLLECFKRVGEEYKYVVVVVIVMLADLCCIACSDVVYVKYVR